MNLSIRKAIAGSIAVLLLSTAGCGGGTADEHLVKAQNFYKSSDIKSAEIELKNALRKDDSLSPARLLLGKIYLEAGRPDFAQTELQRVVDAGTAEEEIYFLLAKAKTEAGNLDAAIDDLKIIKDQGSAKIHTMYGHIYYGKKAWSTAETHYLEALEQDDAYLDAMLGLAHAGVATGKFEQLNKYSTRVTELAADDIRGWLLLAEYHILQRDFDASRTAFSRSLEIDEDNFAAAVGMARTYLAENRYEEAEKYVQIAANVAPEHPHVSFFQAELLFRSGNLEDAYNTLQKAYNASPDYTPGHFLLGLITYGLQQYEQAEEALSAFISNQPEHVGARKILADTRLKLGDPSGAVAVLVPVLSKAAGDSQYLALLSDAYLRSGEASKSSEMLEQALELAPDAKTLRTQLAAAQMMEGAMDEALANLQHVASQDEDASRADLMLVMALLKQQKFDDAIVAADKLGLKLPNNPIVPNLKASAYLGKQDTQSARQELESAIAIQEDYVAAYLNLAQIDLAEGNVESSIARYQQALGFAPNNANALEALAEIAYKNEDADQAIEYLKQAQENNPGAIKSRLLLGRLYLAQRQLLAADAVVDELNDMAPKLPQVRELNARLLMANKNWRDAASELEDLTEEFKDDATIWMLYGEALGGDNQLLTAADAIEKARELDPENANATLALSRLLLRKGDYNEALAETDKFKEMSKDDARGFALAGDILTAKGDIANAVKNYKQAYKLSPSSPYLLSLYRSYERKGDHKSAVKVARAFLDENPKDVGVRFVLASGLQTAEQYSEAAKHYEKILEINERYVLAMNNLAWIYANQSKHQSRALELANKANELAANQPAIMDTLGWVYLQQNQAQKAKEWFANAIQLAPDAADIRYHHALALEQLDSPKIAIQEVKRALAAEKPFAERKDAEALLSRLE